MQAHDHELLPLAAILNAALLAKWTFPKNQTPLLRFINEKKSNPVITSKLQSFSFISYLDDILNVVFSMPPISWTKSRFQIFLKRSKHIIQVTGTSFEFSDFTSLWYKKRYIHILLLRVIMVNRKLKYKQDNALTFIKYCVSLYTKKMYTWFPTSQKK